MKKKILISIIVVVLVLVVMLIILSKTGFFATNYKLIVKEKERNIVIPKYSYFIKNENNKIKFTNFNTIENIKEARNKLTELSSIQQCSTEDITYYFDKDNNITIYDYKIIDKKIYKEVSFKYYIGHYCNDKEMEDIEKELQTLNFEIDVDSISNCNSNEINKIIESDSYDIYTTNCLNDVKVKIDKEELSLNTALKENRLTMDKIIRQFEISSQYAEGTTIRFGNRAFLYYNYEYALLSCKPKDNHTKYVIGNINLEYQKPFGNVELQDIELFCE